MLFEPRKYLAAFFCNNGDVPYEPHTIQSIYLNLLKFGLIPGSNQEYELPQGIVKNRLKYYAIDNSISLTFRSDRIDIECNYVNGKQMLSCEAFTALAQELLSAVEITHPRKSNRMAFVSSFRNEKLSSEEKDNVYNNVFGKLSDISDVPPIEWNHRTCRRYSRQVNGKSEVFNNIFNVARVQGNDIRNRAKIDVFELNLDINTNPENIGLRFSTNDYMSFLSEINDWNAKLLSDVEKKIDNG